MNDLDFENRSKTQGFHASFKEDSTSPRTKTSQRLKYEAEIAVLKKEIGSLEEVRIKLGFSRRKICQLLLVDPSAWTRWTAENQDAPPHIYRALKWYLDSKTHQISRFESQIEVIEATNLALTSKISKLQSQQFYLRIYLALIGAAMIGVLTYFSWRLAIHG